MTREEARKLTAPMVKALNIALRNGAVFAGNGNSLPNGGVTRVAAPVIRALVARGLLTLSTSPDGGWMGTPAPGVKSAPCGWCGSTAGTDTSHDGWERCVECKGC